ncbi:MAG: M20 family metallopeptidase [Gammaproteobacteria bacterium]
MATVSDDAQVKALLERLVSFDTQNPPGRELEAAEYIRDVLNGMGFRAMTSEFLTGRVNVVGIFENGPGPTFAFNTHIDVVPVGDGWDTDPFRLKEIGANLYGRGSCDAKGPLAAMLEAMRDLVASRDSWSGTLMGVFVADEEAASMGAKEYVKTSGAIDYCMIGEPTSCTTVTAHKGSLRPVVRVFGKTAHSGMPDLGVNAILKSARLLDMIVEEHQRVKAKTHNLVGQASLSVTRALGGHADNVVPETCDFLLDRRMVPGEDEEQVKRDLLNLVEGAAKASGVRAEIVEFRPTTGGPTETPADNPIVQASQSACAHHNHQHTALSGFQGGCDLVHFRTVGASGVVLGAGSLAVAHQPNEFVPIDELVRSVHIYRDVALQMLAGGRQPVIQPQN